MLSLVTLLTFANSWPDSLVFDDKAFVGPEPLIKLNSLSEAFTDDIWQVKSTAQGLYRPLLQIHFEIQNRLFGDWLAGYHLVNIFMHLAATLMLFGFLRFLVERLDSNAENLDHTALLPALIFAVHPAHTEVINSVFNGSSIIVSFLAISGLWWLLEKVDSKPGQAWLGLGLCYVLAILFKESALVLPGIAAAMIVLLTTGSFRERIFRMLPVFWLLIPIIIYFLARGYALAPEEVASGDAGTMSSGIGAMFDSFSMSVGHDWITKLALFGKGITVLAWPYPLKLYYYHPTGWTALVYLIFQFVLVSWALLRLWQGKPGMAAGLALYYIALAPSIRVISLDATTAHLSERYLYFPSVGLSMVLVVAYRGLFEKFGRKVVSFLSLPLLVLLAALCWERNSEWASELNLFETEYQQGDRGFNTLRLLISSHYNEERYSRVAQICEENADIYGDILILVNTCASAFSQQGRIEDAIQAFEVYAQKGESWIDARLALASIYLAQGKRQKAADQFVDIINRVEEPERKEIYKGDLLVALYPEDRGRLLRAKEHFRNALKLKPEWRPAQKRLAALEEKLTEIDKTTAQEHLLADPQKDPE